MRQIVVSMLLLSAVALGAHPSTLLGVPRAEVEGQGRGGRGGDQGIAPGQPPGQRWVRLAPIPEPNEERNGVVAGGKLYLFGGNPVGLTGTPPGAVWEYDPAGDKWTKKKNMPLAAHHVAVAETGGRGRLIRGSLPDEARGGTCGVPHNTPRDEAPAASPEAQSPL